MKNKYLIPFALTTLMAALTGCGGESANIIPEAYDSSTENGACTVGSDGCVEFALDYPLDGLNFKCSSDTTNSFITLMDLANNVATGSCRTGDKVNFFIKGEKDKEINLGTVDLSKIALVSTTGQIPRLTILDIAQGIAGQAAIDLDQNDATVKVAMSLVKILQVLALDDNKIVEPTDIQALYITDAMRTKLDLILKSVTTQQIINGEYVAIIQPWVDVSTITDEQAFEVVKKLMTIANAAVYQPEFSLFSTSGVVGNLLSGSDGLVGCNKDTCSTSDTSTKFLFGHFMLITDRQGYTLGSGLQWKGTIAKSLTALSSVNAELIRNTRPVRMTAAAQPHWINPVSKKIDQDYQFDIGEVNSQPLIIHQGKLYNDYMIAGKESFYKLLTKKTTLTASDLLDLGQWQQNTNSGEVYKGSLDLYKIFPITYLDKKVFKSINNVTVGDKYVFPLYADLKFKFTTTNESEVKLGIVIDRNGDIRTNMKPGYTQNDMSTDTVNGCSGADILPSSFIDSSGVQQYRLGTIARTFTPEQSISIRMILAGDTFARINGALVGMNSSIKTSSDSSTENIVVGGALLRLTNLLDPSIPTGTKPATVSFTNSDNGEVKWGNTLASFQGIYNANNTSSATNEDKALAKLNGGSLELSLAPCYAIQMK